MAQTIAEDTIDSVVGLTPGQTTYTARHQRAKVVAATQASEEALFDPALAGLTLSERLCVALYACRLTPAEALAKQYAARLVTAGAEASLIAALSSGTLALLQPQPPRLQAMLTFTHALITEPVKADQAALLALKDAGLSTPEIVTLAQLIAFISYQVRLAAGLTAMKALETRT